MLSARVTDPVVTSWISSRLNLLSLRLWSGKEPHNQRKRRAAQPAWRLRMPRRSGGGCGAGRMGRGRGDMGGRGGRGTEEKAFQLVIAT